MSIVSLLILLIVVGVGLYLVNTVIPMDAKIKTILNVVVVVLVALYVIDALGLFEALPPIGRHRLR